MKKTGMKTVVLGILLLANSYWIMAQSEKPVNPNRFSINAGFSVTGLLFNTLLNGDSVKYSVKNGPAIQLNYDRVLNNWLTVGAGFSSQKFHIKFEEYIDNYNVLQTGDFNADLTRNHAHLKVLAGSYKPTYDLYAGLRLGFVWFNSDLSVEKRELRALQKIDKYLTMGRPTLGVPVGGRYFFTDHVGVNLELNLGAPHFVSTGVTVKF